MTKRESLDILCWIRRSVVVKKWGKPLKIKTESVPFYHFPAFREILSETYKLDRFERFWFTGTGTHVEFERIPRSRHLLWHLYISEYHAWQFGVLESNYTIPMGVMVRAMGRSGVTSNRELGMHPFKDCRSQKRLDECFSEVQDVQGRPLRSGGKRLFTSRALHCSSSMISRPMNSNQFRDWIFRIVFPKLEGSQFAQCPIDWIDG